jgi:hypothetical protein
MPATLDCISRIHSAVVFADTTTSRMRADRLLHRVCRVTLSSASKSGRRQQRVAAPQEWHPMPQDLRDDLILDLLSKAR